MRIIAGEAKGRNINAPRGMDTRPTLDRVRENLFNMLQLAVPGAVVLDLFSGSGALSLEALSRGAVHATMVDHSREANRTETENARMLGFDDRAEIILADWKQALRRLQSEGRRYSLVFLDPPYSMHDLTDVFDGVRKIICEGGVIAVEHMASAPPVVPDTFRLEKARAWGYCAFSLYYPVGEGDNI